MADPVCPPFFVTSLADQISSPKIPDELFTTYLEGKTELMKLKLTSDASDKTWQVKLNGRRLAGGWEDFSIAHRLRYNDVLVFRHVDDMVFHVTPSGRSFSQLHSVSSSSGDSQDNDDSDKDNENDDDGYSEHDCSISKKPKTRTESFSSENSCFLTVTPSNLRLNRVYLSRHYAIRNGLNKRWCEVELRNQSGKAWVLVLRHNKITGQDYIVGAWRSFCRANGLKPGSCYRFKLVKNGTRPVLQFCSNVFLQGNCSKPHGKSNVSQKSSSLESGDDDDDDDEDSKDDDDDSVSKKKSRFETESSSPGNFCLLAATLSNLRLNRVSLSKRFIRTNGLNKKCCEIDLLNPSEESWKSDLRYQVSNNRACIRGGWRSFCRANKLKTGSFYRFKFVKNGTRPRLQLCSDIIEAGKCPKSDGKANVWEKFSGETSMKQNKFLTVTFKPYMLRSRQLHLPRNFMRVNGIKKVGEITLVNKNGVKWPSYVASARGGGSYMTKNWLSFCRANELETGETLTFEFVGGDDSTPMLKFCSKVKIGQALCDGPDEEEEESQEEMKTRVQKKARDSEEGGPSRRTRASNNSSADPRNLQRKQPRQPCSMSDQLTKVKQNIVDTLTGLKRFESELEMKEKNLEAALQEIDALGEKVLEINQFFK